MAQAVDMGLLAKLTEREVEVLRLLSGGLTNTQIARRLHRSIKTVEWHRASLGRKLGVANRVELVLVALRAGLAPLPNPRAAAGHAGLTSEESFRQLAENIDAAFWMISPDERELTYVSPTYEAITAISCESLYADPTSWLEMLHPEDRQRVVTAMEARGSGPHDDVRDNRYRVGKPDGSTGWIRVRSWPVFNEAGTFVSRVGITVDITQHMRAQETLRENEQRFRQLAENINQVFWLTDWTKRELLYVNPAYETVYGRSCQSVYADRHSWIDNVHPEDKTRVAESFARNAELGLYVEEEYQIIHADGSTRWIRDRAFPMRDAKGTVHRFVGLAEDITERKRAEEALRLSQFSLDRAPDAVFWVGPDARFVYVNDAASRALGYSGAELLSMSVHDIDPKFPAEAWADHWQEIKQRSSFRLESLHRAKDGRIFPVEITVNYLELGGKAYNCAFAREIAGSRRAEAGHGAA